MPEKRHLKDVLAADRRSTAHLRSRRIAKLFDPMSYQGVAQLFIDRLLATARGRAGDFENLRISPEKPNALIDADGCPLDVESQAPTARRC